MRPASETHLALIRAAHAITLERAASGQGATLQELAQRAQVGYKVARALVPKLKERGQLQIAGMRKVVGRNRPVAEYVPATHAPNDLSEQDAQAADWWVGLGNCLQAWAK